jgi:uncharacterized protein with PIN domain
VTLKFFFDTHIAKAAAIQLRKQGVDVVRCEEIGMAEADDEELLLYATANERVMVSQDDDFATLHAQWQAIGRGHAGIMQVSKQYQGAAQISHVVRELSFYDEASAAGAIDYDTEIANQLLYV